MKQAMVIDDSMDGEVTSSKGTTSTLLCAKKQQKKKKKKKTSFRSPFGTDADADEVRVSPRRSRNSSVFDDSPSPSNRVWFLFGPTGGDLRGGGALLPAGQSQAAHRPHRTAQHRPQGAARDAHAGLGALRARHPTSVSPVFYRVLPSFSNRVPGFLDFR